jgi:DNA mismatch repair protein MutL
VVGQGPAALAAGTRVEIRELFANTPARLKFLKAETTENKRCQETLMRICLAHPECGFSLTVNGREVFRLPPDQDVAARLRQFWPPAVCEGLASFDFERLGYRAFGAAGSPSTAQSRGDRILLYVNGRPVQDKLMLGAVRQAYKGMLISREYPQVVLFLDIPRDEVDVNVHPAKLEVRFTEESRVFSTIRGGIVQALAAMTDVEAGYPATAAETGADSPMDPGSVFPAGDRADPRRVPAARPASLFTRGDGPKFPSYREFASGAVHPVSVDMDPARSVASSGYGAPQTVGLEAGEAEVSGGTGFFRETGSTRPAELAGSGYTYLGQVADTYLVLRRGQSLVLVDQHAAHERVLLAAMRQARTRGDSQPLALPLELALHASEAEVVHELWDDLRSMGFLLELEGTDTLLVRGIPPTLDTGKAREYLSDAMASKARTLDDLWTMMSCKTAIKAGQPLAVDEALSLLDVWLRTPERDYCPHGRPVVVSWNPQDLEKFFKRK